MQEIQDELQGTPFGPPLILLVPEQATFQMEQGLIRRGVRGSARARVLSFKRLAHMVSSEIGGLSRPHLGELGRKMLLRSLVHRRKGELELFGHVVGRAGFTERLSRTFSEFQVHGYAPQDVRLIADSLSDGSPLLRKKLRDLALLFEDYTTYIADRYADPDSVLGEAAKTLAQSDLLSGAKVWIDGFAGFTPQEFKMLHAIFSSSERVSVSLCLDPAQFDPMTKGPSSEAEEFSLFHLPMETARELIGLCRQAEIAVEPPTTLQPEEVLHGRFGHPALTYIEAAWDNPSATAYAGDLAPIVLQSAEDRISEVESVAGEIHRLVRDEGYRYKDISVIVRNLDTYAPHLASVFAKQQIPYFIDQRRPMLFHPLIQALAASLEAIQSRWHSEPIIRFLKTDLAPIARGAVDLLENYVLEHGITGRAWVDERPWTYGRRLWRAEDEQVPGGEYGQDVDAVRRMAIRSLSQLDGLIGRGQSFTPREAAQALWAFLDSVGAEERISEWIEQADGHDDELVSLHTQVWNAIIDLLEQMANVLPQDSLELPELMAMLDEGFESLHLGIIPPKLDQVLIGSVDRSRHPDVRAVFVLGLVDREFPAVPQEDAVLTDTEREALAGSGFKLGETSRVRMEQEQFYAYIAVTRASERLVLSSPRSDGRGKALLPSSVVSKIRRLFPDLVTQNVRRSGGGDLRRAVTPLQAAGYLVSSLRADAYDERLLDAYEWLVTHPDFAWAVRPTLRSLSYSNMLPPLSQELSDALYGDPLVASISRLERFASCPFQHFAVYGLRLKERAVLRLDPSRLGVLTHAVLKGYVDHIIQNKIDWQTLTDEEAFTIVDALTEAAAKELAGEVLLSSGRQRYVIDLARRTLHTAVRLMNEHARASDFRPVATEVSFGRPGDQVSGWQIPLSNGGSVQLVGVIDRMDHCHIRGVPYVRIVDYKSYRRRMNWSDILQGLELQLIVYLGVASEGHAYAPAGAFYQPVRDPFVDSQADVDPDAAWKLRKAELKADGVLISDYDGAVALSMDSSVTPSSSSTLLPFGFKKDGDFTAHSSVARKEELQLLIARVRGLVVDLAESIRSGDHGVRPFRRKDNKRACERCPYHAVCRFDVLVPGNEYRYLESYGRNELWERIAQTPERTTEVS